MSLAPVCLLLCGIHTNDRIASASFAPGRQRCPAIQDWKAIDTFLEAQHTQGMQEVAAAMEVRVPPPLVKPFTRISEFSYRRAGGRAVSERIYLCLFFSVLFLNHKAMCF